MRTIPDMVADAATKAADTIWLAVHDTAEQLRTQADADFWGTTTPTGTEAKLRAVRHEAINDTITALRKAASAAQVSAIEKALMTWNGEYPAAMYGETA